ncbi:MAG: LytTR family transcriptional regulator DNA-binding domain-containing protein [Bacteroidales bacterium]|nr:LytTR family transcriptional regulator DNA-binding domain-containing protein [Bacteroidales bacterium]
MPLEMTNEQKETIRIRAISSGFTVVAIAIFKPFGLDLTQWQAYMHLLAMFVIGLACCLVTDCIIRFIFKMPTSLDNGVDYIIKRNKRFQLINTPLVALMLCLYRHFVMSVSVAGNSLSWGNFLETLIIIAFCSFIIGIYWRFQFRSRYLTAELNETRQMNEKLQETQSSQVLKAATPLPDSITLNGSTSETVKVSIQDLLYIETVGNYVKIYQLHDGKVRSDMLRATSKQLEDDLSAYPMIVRCHRAFLVNLQQVEEIVSKPGGMLLVIKHCGDAIPVSRSNMAQIKKRLSK